MGLIPDEQRLRVILAQLKVSVELIELSLRIQEQGGLLREAMERLERIPPQLFDVLNGPKPGGDGQ